MTTTTAVSEAHARHIAAICLVNWRHVEPRAGRTFSAARHNADYGCAQAVREDRIENAREWARAAELLAARTDRAYGTKAEARR